MEKNEHLGVYIIFLIFISSSINAQNVCVKTGPCSCEFSNGTGYDLSATESASATAEFLTTSIYEPNESGKLIKLSTYYFHPCVDSLVNATKVIGTDTCTKPLALCRHVINMNLSANNSYLSDGGINEALGSSKLYNFSSDGQFMIFYNLPSDTMVKLICANTDDRLGIFSLEDPQNIVLSFYSRNACLKQVMESGRSVGSTLLIIFFSFVIFYLVLGIGTKKFLMGATGIEIIPNLVFWSELPNLVKDGWLFTVSGFKLPARNAGPTTSPDPNSYDSI